MFFAKSTLKGKVMFFYLLMLSNSNIEGKGDLLKARETLLYPSKLRLKSTSSKKNINFPFNVDIEKDKSIIHGFEGAFDITFENTAVSAFTKPFGLQFLILFQIASESCNQKYQNNYTLKRMFKLQLPTM